MGFDELPQEVLDVIVDFAVSETNYLRDDTTMKACAITSRSLTSRAQRNIFKQVKLIAVKDFSIFESKLASSPRLGAYTAILLVSLGDRRWLQPDVTPSTQRKMGTLAIIFQACPNVDTLRVLVDESISPLHMASLGSTRNLRALRHIHLIGAFGGAGGLAYSVFEAFCSLARRLDVLELSSMELTFDESAPRALVLPDIRRLDMVLVADEQSFNRLTDMLKGCLEELVIHLSKDRAPNQAVQLFSTLGHRLRHLSITGLTDDAAQTIYLSSCVNLAELRFHPMRRSDGRWESYDGVCHILENVGSRSLQRVHIEIDLLRSSASTVSPWAGKELDWSRLVSALSATRQPSLRQFTIGSIEISLDLELTADWPTTLRQQLKGLPEQVSLRIERRHIFGELHSLA